MVISIRNKNFIKKIKIKLLINVFNIKFTFLLEI